MIVYRELASLEKDLGYSARDLYYASNTIMDHYHKVSIPKGNGQTRILDVPDPFLKGIQRSILRNLLFYEEISPYAAAYRIGGSTVANAAPHVNQSKILKLDIRCFFDSITFAQVMNHVFPEDRYSRANRVLLTVLCLYDERLPQGAPTSPAVSNIIMRDFDNSVGSWCRKRQITYTRYSDDMTFSGEFDKKDVISFVERKLRELGFYLNTDKTVMLHEGQRKSVTGIVVNQKVSVPSSYKKKIRQEIYYCRKFGIESHMEKCGISSGRESYIRELLGKINYVLSVEKDNREFPEYKIFLTDIMKEA